MNFICSMGKNDIDKLDEQIKSLLENEKNINDDSDNNHVVFVDRLGSNYQNEEEFTKRIEKIDDIEKEIKEENSSDTEQVDFEKKVLEDKKENNEDDNEEGSLLLILFLVLIIFCLCIILFLFF